MKKVTLNHQICLKKQNVPTITQKELTAWCEQEPGAKPELEHALQEWCLHSQGHIHLTDLILIEKAKTFAKMLNIPDDTLSFSTGWFQSFKNRNNLKRYQLHGESGSADISAIENALPNLKTVISTFKSEDVYNMDETGLLEPDKTLATKQLEGKKKDKQHLTVVLCCNADGTDKLEPLIIGKSLKPQCIGKINMNSLGVVYRANGKTCMTAVLFQEGRELQNTQVKFLPPNCTSRLQPCDAGIIASFKKHYLHKFVHYLLKKVEDNPHDTSKLNVLEAIKFIKFAWTNGVTVNTIVNCWRHTGIIDFSNEEEIEQESENELVAVVERENFLNPVEESETEEPLDDASIICLVQEENNDENQNEEEDSDEESELPAIPIKEGLEALEKVMTCLLQQHKDCPDEIKKLTSVKNTMKNL
nr:2914_t:CDS:2 [Entrophospora candida]